MASSSTRWTRWLRAWLATLVLLTPLALAAAPPASAALATPGWAKSRYDNANTGFNPTEASLSASNVASLAQDWTADVALHASPVAAGGVVYTGCGATSFCAFDATTGAPRWKTVVGTLDPPTSAVLVGNTVFVGASRPPVEYALDAGTGAVLWKTLADNTATDFGTATIAADGVVVQGTRDGYLFGWDATTGLQRWVRRLDTFGTPAVASGVLYVETAPNTPTLQALRISTGETLWSSNIVYGYAGASPTIVAGQVIVSRGTSQGPSALLAYPAAGCGAPVCQPLWARSDPWPLGGSVAAAGGVLYQGRADGYVGAMTATGQLLWRGVTDGAALPIPGLPGPVTIANGLLFAYGGDGSVYAWAAAGCGAPVCQPVWKSRIDFGAVTWNEVVVLDGRLYAVGSSSVLHAFSPRVNPPPAGAPPPLVPPPPPPPTRTTPMTIQVPRDQLSIQRAIDASISGDVILVAPGTYHERIDFHGHAVEVRSSGGRDATVIDGDGVSTVVLFQSNETRASALRGFTVRNGRAEGSGGGVEAVRASPTIVDNAITGNQAIVGNGIDVTSGAPLIQGNIVRDNHSIPGSLGSAGGIMLGALPGTEVRGNLIEDNSTTGSGGGLSVSGTALVIDNTVRGNRSQSVGGGIEVGGDSRSLLAQNVIVDNTSGGSGGGIELRSGPDSGPRLVGNTVAGNTAPSGSGLHTSLAYGRPELVDNVVSGPAGTTVLDCDDRLAQGVPVFSHNDVSNGGAAPAARCGDPAAAGGTLADPRFVAPEAGDYRPGRGSPAIDAGADGSAVEPTDVSGAPRLVDGDGDGVARVDMGAFEAQLPVPEPGAGFRPLPPARILDTRDGTGGINGPVGPGATISVAVAGRGGVPADGVAAVVLNVTVTGPTSMSYLTVFPSGTSRPLASSLNVVAGQTVPNLVTAKLGADGKVAVYNDAGAAHVVIDVAGWYGVAGSTGGARYNALSPARILDTRDGTGGFRGPVAGGSTISPTVTGVGGVPDSGVSAVVLNVTATQPTAMSFLTVFPNGTARPLASNLNVVANQTVPNLVVAKVGDGGKVSVYNNAGTTHVVIDVVGWFGADGGPGGARFYPLPPARVLDTRYGTGGITGPVGPAGTVVATVTGVGGVPASGVAAVVLNATVTQPTAESYLTVFPDGTPRPLASNLNFVAAETVPNLVVAKVGADGKVAVYNNAGTTHVVFDVVGWYAA